MTTLGRSESALLVIDVQNQVVDGAYNEDAVIAQINLGVAKARAAGVPVVWAQHSDEWMAIDSEDWQIVPQLVHADGEARPYLAQGRLTRRCSQPPSTRSDFAGDHGESRVRT